MIGLIAAAVIAFGALLILLAYAEEPGPPGGERPRRAVALGGRLCRAGPARRPLHRGAVSSAAATAIESEDLLVVALTGRGGPAAIAELLRRARAARDLADPAQMAGRAAIAAIAGWVRAVAPGAGRRAPRR